MASRLRAELSGCIRAIIRVTMLVALKLAIRMTMRVIKMVAARVITRVTSKVYGHDSGWGFGFVDFLVRHPRGEGAASESRNLEWTNIALDYVCSLLERPAVVIVDAIGV